MRGRKNRFKARIRRYGSNGISFLEVKHKTVHGRTLKDRVLRSKEKTLEFPLNADEQSFLNGLYPYAQGELTSMNCSFNRCTLVSTERQERVTIDSNIQFQSDENESGTSRIGHIGSQTNPHRQTVSHSQSSKKLYRIPTASRQINKSIQVCHWYATFESRIAHTIISLRFTEYPRAH